MNIDYKKYNMPPDWACKKIENGRLKGKTDINPQWRYDCLTEMFGLCGQGWGFNIMGTWSEKILEELFIGVKIILWYRIDDKKYEIESFGGDMLAEMEQRGLHSNDEAYKMAVTDALGTACKFLGIGAEIYRGRNNSKYDKPVINEEKPSYKELIKKPATPSENNIPDTAIPKEELPSKVVTIQNVEVVTGDKNGKEWKRYGVFYTEGESNDVKTMGTFSETYGKQAQENIGKKVNVCYEVNGKFTNFMGTDGLPF